MDNASGPYIQCPLPQISLKKSEINNWTFFKSCLCPPEKTEKGLRLTVHPNDDTILLELTDSQQELEWRVESLCFYFIISQKKTIFSGNFVWPTLSILASFFKPITLKWRWNNLNSFKILSYVTVSFICCKFHHHSKTANYRLLWSENVLLNNILLCNILLDI